MPFFLKKLSRISPKFAYPTKCPKRTYTTPNPTLWDRRLPCGNRKKALQLSSPDKFLALSYGHYPESKNPKRTNHFFVVRLKLCLDLNFNNWMQNIKTLHLQLFFSHFLLTMKPYTNKVDINHNIRVLFNQFIDIYQKNNIKFQ